MMTTTTKKMLLNVKRKRSSVNKLTALIDGDIFVYQAAAAAERPIQWTQDLWTLHSSLDEATQFFEDKIHKAIERVSENTGCKDVNIMMALSDPEGKNYRKEVWPDYKANRKNKRPPLVRRALYDYVVANYSTYHRPYLEADDVLGILQTSPYIIRGSKLIISSDKDFKTIPGNHYNMDKDEFFMVTPACASYAHMLQTLTGDAADGYPGCPGVGPKKAESILANALAQATSQLNDSSTAEEASNEVVELAWPSVVAAYVKAGLSEDYALTMARLARICQRDDYDFKNKEVILWQPKMMTPQ